jgi:hypothetical protein
MNQYLLNVLSSLEPSTVLEIVVFGFAIAQMLMILLTIHRERDVKELRGQVEDQRQRLIEMRAWLHGLHASQSKRAALEDKAEHEPPISLIGPQSGPQETSASKGGLAQLAKIREWEQDVVARLQSGIKGQQATMPDTASFKWFKDDPDEPCEIIEARRMISGRA